MTKSQSMPQSGRPVPAMNADTEFFWRAASKGELRIQRCADCGELRHPPGPACPRCHSFEWDTTVATGRGSLYSFIVVHHPLPPGFVGPVVVAVVDLAEGARIVTNLLDADPESLTIGEPLEACYVEQAEGWVAPLFRRPEQRS